MMELENKKNAKLLGLIKLKDKLLNLNPLYNRKIRFSLSESLLNSQEARENFSLDLESFFQSSTPEVISRFQKKVVHLQKKNLAVQQEKGYKALFLGVIFVRGYFYNRQNILRLVNAPLFLLPCDFDIKKTKKLSLFFYSERKINYNLLYYLQKELGLTKEKLTYFENKLKNNQGMDGKNYLSFLTQELQTLVAASPVKIKLSRTISSLMREKNNFLTEREEKSRGTSIKRKSEYFQPEPFVRLTLSNKPKNYPENELEIVLNFCLTIDSEPNLSLFRDFEEIVEEYSQGKTINWSKSALALLRGEAENILSYPEPKETSQQRKPLYLPFASDPSQTHILKKIFRDFVQNTLCIDGPPGTGKSQLICNLLANALIYQKKVLVVCEKEVALKVIYDKLGIIGLNFLIIKINELAQTRQIYQEILNRLENNQQERSNYYEYSNGEKQMASLEEREASNLRKIVNYCQVAKEFQTSRQIPLQKVYLKFDRKHQLSPTLIRISKWVKNKEQLDKLKDDLEKYISKFSKIFDIINNLLKELKGEKVEINLLSLILSTKLAQECSKNHQSTKLLESKLKGEEKFLITIQQFVSEEFLAIGELHFFLAKFDESAKENISYFFQKILVDQELSYLDNYNELTRIQREQSEIIRRKKDLVKIILKNKQKENLDELSANQLLAKELNKKRKISSLKKLFPEL
ncbi:9822_t:CDS:2, partial [Funneliformis geosporum]